MRPQRLVSVSNCVVPHWLASSIWRLLFSDSPQQATNQPCSSIRCKAGKSEPGLTWNVPLVIARCTGNAQTVQLAKRQRFENHHLKRTLQ